MKTREISEFVSAIDPALEAQRSGDNHTALEMLTGLFGGDPNHHLCSTLADCIGRERLCSCLDVFRGHFGKEYACAAANLLCALSLCPGELSSLDLTRLDLSRAELASDLRKSDLSGSLIRHESFFPTRSFSSSGSISLSPDGKRLIIVSDRVYVRDCATGELLFTLEGFSSFPLAAFYSSNGKYITTPSLSGSCCLFDAKTGRRLHKFSTTLTGCGKSQVSSNEKYFCSCSEEDDRHIVRVVEADSGNVAAEIKEDRLCVLDTTFSSDSKYLLVSYCTGKVKLLEISSNRVVLKKNIASFCKKEEIAWSSGGFVLRMTGDEKVSLSCESTGEVLFYIETDRNGIFCRTAAEQKARDLRLGTLKSESLLAQFPRILRSSCKCGMSADGTYLVCAYGEQPVIWNTAEKRQLISGDSSGHCVADMCINPDGTAAAAFLSNGSVVIYDLPSGQERIVLRRTVQPVTTVASSADGEMIAFASCDGTIKIVDARTGHVQRIMKKDCMPISELSFSEDKAVLTACTRIRRTTRWDVSSGAEIETTTEPRTDCIARSGDRKLELVKKGGRAIEVRCPSTGEIITTFMDSSWFRVTRGKFSPDGSLIALGRSDGITTVFVPEERKVINVSNRSEAVTGIAISGDNRYLLTAHRIGPVVVTDVTTGETAARLSGHADKINSVCFCGSDVAVTASSDGTVRLWNVKKGTPLRTITNLREHRLEGCRIAALHPDSTLSPDDLALLAEYGAIAE